MLSGKNEMIIKNKIKSLFHLLKKGKKKIKPYHIDNIEKVNKLVSIKDKYVLVVGCSTGVDCRLFVQYGAYRVDGIDVSDKIGTDFRHRKVKYLKNSAEKMVGIDDEKYLRFSAKQKPTP
jgi:SAM-dependent methyltransferase